MLKDLHISTLQSELSGAGETTLLEGDERTRWAVHGVQPSLVCSPSTPEGVAAALAGCDRVGAAVIPWGGGTQQRLGLPPRQADVVVTTRQMNRLLEYEPADLTVTVEAGMRFEELQLILGGKGQWLPLDPPLKTDATVGGLIATNVSGSRRLKEGGLRDLVIGTRVANVDGTVTRAGGRVVKNVTGYDLNKLHIGVLGTLGLVVEATFKVAPRPETERSWVGVFSSPESAGRAMGALMRRPLAATALDLLNDRAAVRVGLAVPAGHWALLGRASGLAPAVARHLVEFEAVARAEGAVEAQPLAEEVAGPVWAGVSQVGADLRWAADSLTCRLAVPPAAMGHLCRRAADLGGEAVLWGHATGALFWSVPLEGQAPDRGALSQLRQRAEEAGGALVAENWPSAHGALDVWGKPSGPIALMQAIKNQYDPHGILNPGRFVGGI